MRHLLLIVLVISAVGIRADEVRVLFIGNSVTYWNEMPWMVGKIAESLDAKPPLRADFSGGGGMSMRQHWLEGRAKRAIAAKKWDFVVLQPQSSELLRNPDETKRYTRLFDTEIRRAGAKTLLFLGWTRRESIKQQAEINRIWTSLARELGATVVPVATAWHAARARGIEMYDASDVHPTLAGTYLVACTFFSALYHRPPTGATHTFDVKFNTREESRAALEKEKIDGKTARVLQAVAWEAVKR